MGRGPGSGERPGVGQVAGTAGPEPPSAAALADRLSAASRGDAEAWGWLVTSYHRRVYGLLVRQCGDRELAEEITQATFVKLVQKLPEVAGGPSEGEGRYSERGRFEPWLFRVAMNGLRDEMRRRKRQAVGVGGTEADEQGGPGLPAAAAPGGDDPLDRVDRAEQVERLREAVAELGEADREVLHLRHTAGLSFAEIAQALGQPLGTVLARAHRALGKLRKRLEEQEAALGRRSG